MITVVRNHKRASFHTAVALANAVIAISKTWSGKRPWKEGHEIVVSINPEANNDHGYAVEIKFPDVTSNDNIGSYSRVMVSAADFDSEKIHIHEERVSRGNVGLGHAPTIVIHPPVVSDIYTINTAALCVFEYLAFDPDIAC